MADTLKAGIYSALSGSAAIGALVGDEIYPDRAPQDTTLPFITYFVVSEEGVHHQAGVGDKARTTIQFTVWASSATSRSAIKQALRDEFDGQIRQTFGSSFCMSVRNTNNNDVTEDPIDGSQNFSYGSHMDFEFWHIR
jgi:hypothetical protein